MIKALRYKPAIKKTTDCKHVYDTGIKQIRIDNYKFSGSGAFFRVVYCKKCKFIEPVKLEIVY